MAKNEANEKVMAAELDDKATAPPAADAPGSTAGLEAEIDAAIERIHAGKGDADDDDPPAGEGEGVEQDPGDASGEKPEAEDKGRDSSRDANGRFTKAAPKDETIERAVKAGFSLAEAKEYQTDTLLAAMCDRIEGFQKAKTGEDKPAGDKKGGDEAPPADPLAAIPDLDPTVFDPKLADAFKSLKELARGQQKIIEELRGDRSKGFVATKLEGLKSLTKGDASKEAAVRVKFDVLTAGYKAAKQEVTEEAVFAEAAQLVLGAEAAADKAAKAAEAAGKRSGQRIARPTGRNVEAKPDDVNAEIAAEIDKKFFAAK